MMGTALVPAGFTEPQLGDMRRAVELLERNSLVNRISGLLGRPVDGLLAALPAGASGLIQSATGAALRSAAGGAVRTVPARGAGPTGWGWFDRQLRSDWAHKAATAVSGAGGGFAGLPGVLAELPVTTALMLRAIAQIGAEEGEDVWSEEGRRQCLQVFAFGGPSRDDDQAETGYIAVRLALAELVANAAGQPLRALLPGFLLAVAERMNHPSDANVVRLAHIFELTTSREVADAFAAAHPTVQVVERSMDSARQLDALLDHRLAREAAILGALGAAPHGSRAITDALYADVDPRLRRAAERNVIAHLAKLAEDGLVRQDGDGWVRV